MPPRRIDHPWHPLLSCMDGKPLRIECRRRRIDGPKCGEATAVQPWRAAAAPSARLELRRGCEICRDLEPLLEVTGASSGSRRQCGAAQQGTARKSSFSLIYFSSIPHQFVSILLDLCFDLIRFRTIFASICSRLAPAPPLLRFTTSASLPFQHEVVGGSGGGRAHHGLWRSPAAGKSRGLEVGFGDTDAVPYPSLTPVNQLNKSG